MHRGPVLRLVLERVVAVEFLRLPDAVAVECTAGRLPERSGFGFA